MTFTPRSATVFSEVASVRPVVRAFRKLGKPVVLVPVDGGVDAADLYRLRQAQRVPGALTVVSLREVAAAAELRESGADVVLVLDEPTFYPHGSRTLVGADSAALSHGLTSLLKLINITAPTDVFLSEKDYEFLRAAQHMVTDFNLDVRLHAVPIVREPDGLAVDARNRELSPAGREAALALSAALVAGAHAAHAGADAVLAAARAVLAAVPEVQVESLHVSGSGPEDARLHISAVVEGITLTDHAGILVGVSKSSLGEQAGV